MVSELVKKLKERKLTISTVESCTGGMIASQIVSVSGASSVFSYGFVTYSNEAKMKIVGVPENVIQSYGVISGETAVSMADGGRKLSGSDICISVTGVAGPSSEEDKEVGLVYIGISTEGYEAFKECHFRGDRQYVRENSMKEALNMALSYVKSLPEE